MPRALRTPRPRAAATLAALAAFAACGDSPTPRPEPIEFGIPPFTVLGRWEQPGAIPYRLDPSGGPLEARAFAGAVEAAMRTWAETGRVAFRPAEGGEPRTLLIRWEDGSDPASLYFGRDTSVAVTRGVGTELCEVIFDAARPWALDGRTLGAAPATPGERPPPDLFQAALHELGHAIGLGHVQDESSVMHLQREAAGAVLGPADLAGVHSLYGGGWPGPGDLVVGSECTLYRVAPPDITDWTVHDTDGDGDDEVLVWETSGPRGHLTIYHFEPGPNGPRLTLTEGPRRGGAATARELERTSSGDLDGDGTTDRVVPNG